MSLAYAREKLGEAVNVLQFHPGEIQHRVKATLGPLGLVPVEFLPADLRQEYDAIWAYVNENKTRTFKTATPMAERIVTLEAKLSELLAG